MSNASDIVKEGYLKKRKTQLKVWEKTWVMLRCKSSRGPPRLEFFENKEAAQQKTEHKVILLEDISKAAVEQKHLTLYFDQCSSKKLSATTEAEANEWFDALRHEADTLLMSDRPTDQSNLFHVHLLPNRNTNHRGDYCLQVTAENIKLYDPSDVKKAVVTWNFFVLRYYSQSKDTLILEVGRSAETGEGTFMFQTKDCYTIYELVHASVLKIANNTRSQKSQVPEGQVFTLSKTVRDHYKSGKVQATQPKESHGRGTEGLHSNHPEAFHAITQDDSSNYDYAYADIEVNNKQRELPVMKQDDPDKFLDEEEYIYQEKGLSMSFRKFLSKRKDDF